MNVDTIEQDREDATRKVRCPVCKAPEGKKCRLDGFGPYATGVRAHTGRYLLAASRGLVPLLPGTSDKQSGAGGGGAGSPTTRGGGDG